MTKLIDSLDELNNRTLGRQFRQMREDLGMSQKVLAARLGIGTYNTIANYELGKTSIPHSVWLELESLAKPKQTA